MPYVWNRLTSNIFPASDPQASSAGWLLIGYVSLPRFSRNSQEERQFQYSANMIWDNYTGKILFVTGGTGLIGTAVLYRLLTQANPEHIYVLCRGGFSWVLFNRFMYLPVTI